MPKFFSLICIVAMSLLILNSIWITIQASRVGQTVQKKLINLVEYNTERQKYPKTIRVIIYDEVNSNFEIDFLFENQVPMVIGNNKPLEVSLDPRTISTGRIVGFHEIFKYTVLIWIKGSKHVENLLENVKMTINRRFDRVIILTDKEELLSKLMSHEITQNLLIKFGMSFEKGEIWVDPLIHNGGEMIKVENVEGIPEKKRMGGNLHGRHFKIAGTEFPPVMYRTADSDDIHSFNGTHINIVRAGSEKFNYTYEFSYDWNYGEYWPNGTWTGMYSRVFDPEKGYHFTIALSTEYIWNYGVDMASIIDPLDFMFATNQPQTKLEWYAFLLPFSPQVWICIIMTFITLAIVQFFVMYFIHDRQFKYVVWDSAFYLPYAMATEQGLCDIPKGARYLSLLWLLGCLVLGTGYKSTLRNNLSFPTPEKIPRTFEELGDRKDYGVTVFSSGSAEKHIIQGSSMKAMINIRQRMEYSYDLDKCLRDVYQHHHTVCISWSCLLFHQTARSLTVNSQVNPLVFSKNTPKVNLLSMAFQKDSIFVDSYTGLTEGVFETGIITKLKMDEDYKSKKEGIKRLNKEKTTNLYRLLVKQTKTHDSDRYPLKMINLWVIFSILPLGVVLGTILFGIEYSVFSNINKQSKISLLGDKTKNTFLHSYKSSTTDMEYDKKIDIVFGKY